MSRRPALPVAERYRVMQTLERRRQIQREIARLLDEKRALPKIKDIAAELNVCCAVVRRVVNGDPYRTRHEQDEQVVA